jgi:hypothetical protein
MKSELNTDGCIALIGAVIRCAIQDALNTHRDNRVYRATARDFVFTDGRLEEYLSRFGLREYINCDYIRRYVKSVKKQEPLICNPTLQDSQDSY